MNSRSSEIAFNSFGNANGLPLHCSLGATTAIIDYEESLKYLTFAI